MRILFVTLRALEVNSSVTLSNLGLLNGLLELGCKIDLVMPSWNSEESQNDFNKYSNKINITRIQGTPSYKHLLSKDSNNIKKGFLNILRKLYYKINLYDRSKNLINRADINMLSKTKYDIIISTSDPKTSHIFVKKLIRQGLQYKTWIQHWGDPMSQDITKSTIHPNFYLKYKEEQILSWADKIIYVSPLTKMSQKGIFPKQKRKMHFIPLPYYQKKEYPKPKNEKFTIGYFGDYNSNTRNIIPLYEYCAQVRDVKLIIAGNSNISLEQKENIKILPRVEQEEVNKLEAKCDVLVCVCNKSGTQIPGKIYYYSATNKPILVLLDGEYQNELRRYLSKYNRFNLCENNNRSISEQITRLSRNPQLATPCIHFSSVEIAKQIIDIASN